MGEYAEFHRHSIADREAFWREEAKLVEWHRPFDEVLDYSRPPFARWYVGGRTNLCHNAVDRHLATRGEQQALVHISTETDQRRTYTFRELHAEVNRCAAVLKAQGVAKGDRVLIYMPMIPETAFAMLACARIGAIHSVVFGGFSAESLRDRILDARCKVVLTANEGMRGGRAIPLKAITDRAVEGLDLVETVLVARRTATEVPMQHGRDHWLDEEMRKQRSTCTVAWMGAEDPLFILYTSGSTGKPKGVMHTTGGYLTYAA